MEAENSMGNFVHLHVHTEYSLLDGAIRLKDLIKRVKEFNMGAVAITDHGTMHGVMEFYEKAKAAEIKPIIGCEFYIAPRLLTDKTPSDGKKFAHLVLLAKNMEGYKNLCRLASISQIDGFYYKPRIDREVIKKYSKGLIAMSACLKGEIPSKILSGDIEQADSKARFYQEIYGEDNFFLEVQDNGIDRQNIVNKGLLDMSSRLSIPLVATNDCHYLDKDHVRAHDVLLCIQTGKTVNDTARLKFSTDQLYLKSPDDMIQSFADYPGAIENTLKIAERCDIEFNFKSYHFPKFDTGSDKTPDQLFDAEVRQGFEKRLEKIKKKGEIDEKLYKERLEYEISVIKEMGFSGYFLIVADFIRYSKENDIPVGPGRGSAAGSIVAFSMRITDLDPIEHGLIFERFLNPSRMSMPDIDVDFCINGRERVFKYVQEKYGGGDYVAQIITFGKLKTRAVIRDVGRALNIPLSRVDAIAKMVPDVINISLENALKEEPRLAQAATEDPDIAELIKVCKVLEGLPRHASTHAAGVVIGDKPLIEYMPLYKGKKGETVTQFDMKIVEKIGLVKFDFLGLRNLTVIKDALNLIENPPDISALDLSDEQTYSLISSGNTTGVFQLESSGMKDLLVRLKPSSFDDLTAAVALYRPGPLGSGMVDDFVERKHGRKELAYLLPQLEPILKNTYGVIVYQEQVMKIAVSLAGYSMADADGLRKAMGKKIPAIMAQHRDLFMTGSQKAEIPQEKARQIFDLMEKFGGYGFNKSHSAAYALISFQTAFLKAHFPLQFMAALLTSEMHSTDNVVKYIAECKHRGIKVLGPDINESLEVFTVDKDSIRFGLAAIKNVGAGAIESVLEVRKEGKFTSIFDFCQRVNLRKANKKVLENLVKAGAFDCIGVYRSRLMNILEAAVEHGQSFQRKQDDNQMGLFDLGSKEDQMISLPKIPEIDEWDQKMLLEFEKNSLGFYVTGHPLSEYESIIEQFATANTTNVSQCSDGDTVRIIGILRNIKTIKTKNDKIMAFASIEDMHSSVEVTIFSNIYEVSRDIMVIDTPLLVQGKVEKKEQEAKILAEQIMLADEAEERCTVSLHINIEASRADSATLKDLKALLKKHPGDSPTYLHIIDHGITDTVIALSDIRLRPGKDINMDVNQLMGYEAVRNAV